MFAIRERSRSCRLMLIFVSPAEAGDPNFPSNSNETANFKALLR